MLTWLLSLLVLLSGGEDQRASLDDAAARLLALSPDPSPDAITNATHYWVSNERRLDLFADDVRGLGGVYLGVGTDQSYILAGWARPQLVVLVDFDQDVVDLHAVYGAFFGSAEDPSAFRALWTEGGAALAESVLERSTSDAARRTRLLALYREARPRVHERFMIMQTKMIEADERWFLDDAQQYAHVRSLHGDGRVIALRGDFTHEGAVRDVARTLAEAGLTVRVLYLSNIEQYFMYGSAYKNNMLALPVDARSVVLRTLPGRPAGFEYIVQTTTDFHAWLRARSVRSVYRIRGLSKGDTLTAGERHLIASAPPAPRSGE